jgi:hypothetical protein
MMQRIDVPAEVANLDDDYAAANAYVEIMAMRQPDTHFEVWYPTTTEANYDVATWSSEHQKLVTLPPFERLSPGFLYAIGARL